MLRPFKCSAALLLVGVAVLVAADVGTAMADPPSHGRGYNSIPRPLPGNIPSVGAEAYSFEEFGNEITLAGPAPMRVPEVTVTMSSWGCQSGHWYSDDCSTSPGATFTEPIKLNIYNAPASGTTPGSLITSMTKTFSIPYRPSADNIHCTGTNLGHWYDQASKTCFNGLAHNITFQLGPHVKLPKTIVFGITYNTTDHGYHPYGPATACFISSGGCPYDSLNIGLSEDPNDVSVGSNPNPGTVWQNSSVPAEYCDGGAAGVSKFRLDSPPPNNCWSVNSPAPPYLPPYYVPSVRFAADGGDHGDGGVDHGGGGDHGGQGHGHEHQGD